MSKSFFKFCFVSFLFLFSINNSSAFILPPNGCSISSASHTFNAISATGKNENSLDGVIPLCIVDLDLNQSIKIFAEGGQINTVNSGGERKTDYNKVFKIMEIDGIKKSVEFLVSDGPSEAQADYTFIINPAPIVASVTRNEGIVLSLDNLNGSGTVTAKSGDTISLNCSSCTDIKIYKNGSPTPSQTISDTNGSYNLNFTFSKLFTDTLTTYVLAKTNYKIEYGNIANKHTVDLNIEAKPITTIVTNQNEEVNKINDTKLVWQSNGNSCSLKYSTGESDSTGMKYNSFSRPSIVPTSNPAPTESRDMTEWTATVPTKKLGPGLYGYEIVCRDNQNGDRELGPVGIIKLKLSTDARAQLFLDADPNYLIWKCVNSSQSFIDNQEMSGSVQGRIKNDDKPHTLRCQNLSTATDTTASSTISYNPPTLTLNKTTDNNQKPTVAVNYSCPANNFKRAELFRNKTQLKINNGTYSDLAVSNSLDYLYKLYCYDTRNILSAYSQKSISANNNIVSTDTTDGPVSCAYQASDKSIKCKNIPVCQNGSPATQYNDITDGDSVIAQAGPNFTTSYFYNDSKNQNIYQYRYSCSEGNKKILPALVPPFSHFLNFTVSTAYIQANTTINLNWNIQNPNSTCSIIPKYINSQDGLNDDLKNFKEEQEETGSDLYREITGQRATTEETNTINSSRKLRINKSTRFIASCRETKFPNSPLNGVHKIIRDVYVVGEGER